MATQTYTIQEQITQQRQQIAVARREAEAEAKRIRLPKRDVSWQLKNRDQALSGRTEATAQQRKAIGQSMISGVLGQERAFEVEVAKTAPEYSKEQYLSEAYSEAKSAVQPKIDILKSRIQSRAEQVQSFYADNSISKEELRSMDALEDADREDKDELNVIESTLGNKKQFVQQHFSGELSARASYARDRRAAKTEFKSQQKSLAKELGLSYSDMQQKFSDVNKGVRIEETFTPIQIRKLEQAKIIEYKNVAPVKQEAGGYFLDSKGQGFSSQLDLTQAQIDAGYKKTATMSEVRGGNVVLIKSLADIEKLNKASTSTEPTEIMKPIGTIDLTGSSGLMFGKETIGKYEFSEGGNKINLGAMTPFESAFGKSYKPEPSKQTGTLFGEPYYGGGEVRPLTESESFKFRPWNYLGGGLKGLWADVRTGALLQAQTEGMGGILTDRSSFQNETKEILLWADTQATKQEQARGVALGVTAASLFLPLDWKTKTSIVLNTPKMASLFELDKETTKQEKIYKLKDYGWSLGTSVATGAVFGGAMNFGGKYLEKKGLEYIFKLGSSKIGQTFPTATGIISTTLVGGGKAIQTGTDLYFRTKFIGEGIDVLQLTKEKQYESAKMKATQLTGGILGAVGGTYVGGKTFYTLFTKPSLKESPGVKTRVPTIQSGLITSGQKLVAQRTEELTVKSLFKEIYNKVTKPNKDIYNPKDIEEPTSQKFFRVNPKTKKGANVLSLPNFIGGKRIVSWTNAKGKTFTKEIGPKSVKDLFKQSYSFFRKSGASAGESLLLSIGELPVTKFSMTRDTRGIKIGNKELRQRIELEKATKGGLSKKTRQDYLDYVSKRRLKTKSELELSDKALQRNVQKGGGYEEEAVARKPLNLGKFRLNFIADERGNLVPVKEFGKSKGKFNLSTIMSNIKENWRFKSNVRKLYGWEAGKQYKLFKKYGEKYVDPYQHSYPHAARTAELAVVLSYLEGKGGKKQIEKAYKAGLMHDISKSQEMSGVEGGWEHGFRAFQVGKANKLPVKVDKAWLQAIKVHDTLKKSNFKKASIEKKILKSADVLQLGFEFKNGEVVPSRYYKGKISSGKGDRGLRMEEVPIEGALDKIKTFTKVEPEKARMLSEVFNLGTSVKLQTKIALMKRVLYPNKRFYHGTSKVAAAKIIEGGLKPSKKVGVTNYPSLVKGGAMDPREVFVSPSKEAALKYAEKFGTEAKVIEVELTSKQLAKSRFMGGERPEVAFKGEIKSSQIEPAQRLFKDINKYNKQNRIQSSNELQRETKIEVSNKEIIKQPLSSSKVFSSNNYLGYDNKNKKNKAIYSILYSPKIDNAKYDYGKVNYSKAKYDYSKKDYYPDKYYKPSNNYYPSQKYPKKEYPREPYKVPPYKYPPTKYPPYKTPPYKTPPYKTPPRKAPPIKTPPTIFNIGSHRFKPLSKGKAKLFNKTIYTPSVGASILKIRAKTKPKALIGETSYSPGWRPLLEKY